MGEHKEVDCTTEVQGWFSDFSNLRLHHQHRVLSLKNCEMQGCPLPPSYPPCRIKSRAEKQCYSDLFIFIQFLCQQGDEAKNSEQSSLKNQRIKATMYVILMNWMIQKMLTRAAAVMEGESVTNRFSDLSG